MCVCVCVCVCVCGSSSVVSGCLTYISEEVEGFGQSHVQHADAFSGQFVQAQSEVLGKHWGETWPCYTGTQHNNKDQDISVTHRAIER